MNKIEIFNAAFGFVFFVVGFWTAIAWMHKQIYILKNAISLKKALDENGIKGSLLECFWRVKNVVEPKKFSEIKFKWGKNDD
mgnify:CR=1 FL=1